MQTDGEDSHSKIKAHTITKELQERGVVVDSVMISKCFVSWRERHVVLRCFFVIYKIVTAIHYIEKMHCRFISLCTYMMYWRQIPARKT